MIRNADVGAADTVAGIIAKGSTFSNHSTSSAAVSNGIAEHKTNGDVGGHFALFDNVDDEEASIAR